MSEWPDLGVYAGLLTAGLAGGLHCVGMCGPILIGLVPIFERTREGGPRRGSLARDLAFYHAGRIWSYGLLGLVAGFAGQGVREGAAWLGWQRPVSFALAAAVIVAGLVLLGVVPGLRPDGLLSGCGVERLGGAVGALIRGRGVAARLLLGAVLGFLPCGLVYAMLVAVATLPTPWHAAAGMMLFGLGTLPLLTALLALGRSLPLWLRANGTRLAAITLILAGCAMTARTLIATPEAEHCATASAPQVPQAPHGP